MVVQSAVRSFACGILSFPDEKAVDAGARSLRMIFQSKLAPKYDILQEKHMKFMLSVLNSENENVSELAASIISHSCEKNAEQKALCDAGALAEKNAEQKNAEQSYIIKQRALMRLRNFATSCVMAKYKAGVSRVYYLCLLNYVLRWKSADVNLSHCRLPQPSSFFLAWDRRK